MTARTGNGLFARRPALAASEAAAGVATAALAILTTIAGLQLLRLFIPTLVFYLGDTLGISIFVRAGIGAAVFLTSLLAAPLARLLGQRAALALTAGGALLLRVAAQLFTAPPVAFGIGIAGSACFFIFLPLLLGAARQQGAPRVGGVAIAFLAGVAADTALHVAAGTYDLVWQSGALPLAAVFLISVAGLAALARLLPAVSDRPADVPWRRAWPLLAFGPWLVLALTVFQNVARLAALTGWSLPAAGLLISAANIAALAGATRLAAGWPRWAALLAGAALVALLVPGRPAPLPAALLTVAGNVLAAVLLVRAISASAGGESRAGLRRTTLAFSLGQLLFFLLFFAHNAPQNLVLPYAAASVLPLMGLAFALPAALAPAGPQERPAWSLRALAIAAFLLLLAPAALFLSWQAPQPVAPAGAPALRFLQYNLHIGFNTAGRIDLEALAAVVEELDADVVALQEVSRGWVITGSADMLSWLANRLGMAYVSGPTTTDGLWGNAILSRYPILATSSGPLPSQGMALQRGWVAADIESGRGPVRVIATHLHQYLEDTEARQRQIPPLLAARGDAPAVILAGDLNAWPGYREMEMLAEAGLVDAVAALTNEPAYTNPADAPMQRIDYVWLSPNLEAQSFEMPVTTASDHLPVFVIVGLPDR
jgi:endonuclease/exonuclease/phosphatase family metal-dependent hydrolase